MGRPDIQLSGTSYVNQLLPFGPLIVPNVHVQIHTRTPTHAYARVNPRAKRADVPVRKISNHHNGHIQTHTHTHTRGLTHAQKERTYLHGPSQVTTHTTYTHTHAHEQARAHTQHTHTYKHIHARTHTYKLFRRSIHRCRCVCEIC